MWPFGPRKHSPGTPEHLESRQEALGREIAALRGDFTAWELRMTELVTRLSNQLRRMSALENAAKRRAGQEDEDLVPDDFSGNGSISIEEYQRRSRGSIG